MKDIKKYNVSLKILDNGCMMYKLQMKKLHQFKINHYQTILPYKQKYKIQNYQNA